MKRLITSIVLSCVVVLSGCRNGDSDVASPVLGVSSAVTSNVVKGIIRNGVVTVSRWQSDAYVEVARTVTNDAGVYQVDIPDAVPGEVLLVELELSTDEDHPTEMLCDAAVCGNKGFGEWVRLTQSPGLQSWVSVGADGAITAMPMTPVSTLLVALAERVGGGEMDAAALAVAKSRIAALFNLSDADLLVLPGNVANGVFLQQASPASLKLSLLSAAFAQIASDGSGVDEVITEYRDAFLDNDGRLLQAGGGDTLLAVYQAIDQILNQAGNPLLHTQVSAWLDNAKATLKAGELSAVCRGDAPCAGLDTNRFLNALGIGPDSLGADLRRVMQEQQVETLEALLAHELTQFEWLVSSDTSAIASIAVQAITYTVVTAVGGTPFASEGLSASFNRRTRVLHIEGLRNGMSVNIDITVPVLATALRTTQQFSFAAVGRLENDRVTATIDGTLHIDARGTNFNPLVDAFIGASSSSNALGNAVANILRTGQFRFVVDGEMGLKQNGTNSALAVNGKAFLNVEMAGGVDGAIKASGGVDHGTLTLPNQMVLRVDPVQGESLQFALATDGTLSSAFHAVMLGHDANVTVTGQLANLGPLLSHLRDGVVAQLQSSELSASLLWQQLLDELPNVRLSFTGQADIPDFAHRYTLSYANQRLVLTQPNSTDAALTMTFSSVGMLLRAQDKWWFVGLDTSDTSRSALMLSDDAGGAWRFDISALLAGR